jgi:hypothetical protein
MTGSDQQIKKLMEERAARLHFAAFIKARFGDNRESFKKDVLSGSMAGFQTKLNVFVGDLKKHMTKFVKG